MTLVGLPMYFVLKGAVQDTDHYEASLVQDAVHLHELLRVEFTDAIVLVLNVVVLLLACPIVREHLHVTPPLPSPRASR